MPRVLFLGDEFHATLAAVRGLSDAGLEVVLGTSAFPTYASRSRAVADVQRIPDPDSHPDEFSDAVARIGGRVDAVLPGTESSLVVLSARRDRLGSAAASLPAREIVELAVDKPRVLALAEEVGLATVPSESGTAAELAERAGGLDYPVILKPMRSKLPVGDGELQYFRAQRLGDEQALRAALEGLPGEWLVQPFLHAHLAAVAGVAHAGDVLATVHQRALRIWPPQAGYSSAAVTEPADERLDEGVRGLLARVGWTGVFQTQFLRTAEAAYLIDFNPRPYGSLALAQAAGADLVGAWARIVLGEEPRPGRYRAGVRFRLEHNDAFAIARLLARRELRAAAAAALPRRRTTHAVLSLRDPGPLLVTAAKLGRRVARR